MWQAKEIIKQLEFLLKPHIGVCRIRSGLGFVQVLPIEISKGKSVKRILEEVRIRSGHIDFIMILSDNQEDEEIFSTVKSLRNNESDLFVDKNVLKCFTCTVGMKPSKAHYYINDSRDIIALFERLRGWSNFVSFI